MKRIPKSLYSVGEEPDPRFTLANERTFLAWIRTSGALFALAFALDAFDVGTTGWVKQVMVVLLSAGALFSSIEAWRNWKTTERALRLVEPLPSRSANAVVAGLLSVVLAVFLVDRLILQTLIG